MSIAALVFDTTSLNTGHRQGIIVRLEEHFGRSLLQFACRHHILELVCGASCVVVYGASCGPDEKLFKILIDNWHSLDKKNYSPVEQHRSRQLKSLVKEMIIFLQEWLKNSSKANLRQDYRDIAILSLLFLGGDMPESFKNVTIKAPGACHHARWMNKVLYTLKIALLRKQLVNIYTPEQLEEIVSLATFLSIFYVKPWLTCTSADNAPYNDLELIKKFLKIEAIVSKDKKSWPPKFLSLVTPARQKLENHLWYLSERLVPLAIFSDYVLPADKKKMKEALLKYQGPAENTVQEMPHPNKLETKFLENFIGNDSWTLFNHLGIDSSFIHLSVSDWNTSSSYLHGKKIISNLPVVNDAAERALGLATDKNTKEAPRNENDLQDLYKVVKGVREKLGNLATSAETVTKKTLITVDFKWK